MDNGGAPKFGYPLVDMHDEIFDCDSNDRESNWKSVYKDIKKCATESEELHVS
jgi:hypothetical protein